MGHEWRENFRYHLMYYTNGIHYKVERCSIFFFFFVCSFHINRIQRQWWGTEVSTAGISGSFFFLVYTFRIGRCHAELGAVAARLRPTSRQSILITTKKTPPFSSAIPVVTRVIYAPIPKGENIHLGITSSLANVWILKWKKRRRKKYVNSKGSITLRGVCVCSFAWIQHGRYRYWLKRFFFLFWTPGMPVWQMCVSIQRYTIQQSSPPPPLFLFRWRTFHWNNLRFEEHPIHLRKVQSFPLLIRTLWYRYKDRRRCKRAPFLINRIRMERNWMLKSSKFSSH